MPAAAVAGVSPATGGVPPLGGGRRRRLRGERHFTDQSRGTCTPAFFSPAM